MAEPADVKQDAAVGAAADPSVEVKQESVIVTEPVTAMEKAKPSLEVKRESVGVAEPVEAVEKAKASVEAAMADVSAAGVKDAIEQVADVVCSRLSTDIYIYCWILKKWVHSERILLCFLSCPPRPSPALSPPLLTNLAICF